MAAYQKFLDIFYVFFIISNPLEQDDVFFFLLNRKKLKYLTFFI